MQQETTNIAPAGTRGRLRLGWAAYRPWEEQGNSRDVREHARRVFLSAVATVCPQSVSELKRDVFPLWLRVNDRHKWGLYPWADLRQVEFQHDEGLDGFDPGDGKSQAMLALATSLRSWARRYNIEEDWVLEEALIAFGRWLMHGDDTRRTFPNDSSRAWGLAPGDNPGAHDRPFRFDYPAWQLDQFLDEYEREAREAFEKELAAYLEPFRDLYERYHDITDGRTGEVTRRPFMVPAPSKRDESHFIWTARFQLMEEPNYKRLADELRVDTSALRREIRAVAKLIGMTSRPVGPGRRKS